MQLQQLVNIEKSLQEIASLIMLPVKGRSTDQYTLIEQSNILLKQSEYNTRRLASRVIRLVLLFSYVYVVQTSCNCLHVAVTLIN